jgi:undecaprenyl-diphosphatase
MSLLNVLILAVVQGVAELLPVSSSAHVVVAERLMGLDPASPEMTLLLVMLHTGTTVAVIWYFWPRWRQTFFQSNATLKRFAFMLAAATILTGLLGEVLIAGIERVWLRNGANSDIEQLFGHLELIAGALAVAGALIIVAGAVERKRSSSASYRATPLQMKHAALIGVVQAFCLPFRGFSRSGATISTGMLAGLSKIRAEEFSFALAVILTPPVVAREARRLIEAEHGNATGRLASAMMPSLLGAGLACCAGLLALRWLSRWLEGGRWHVFGIYCLVAAVAVAMLHHVGY